MGPQVDLLSETFRLTFFSTVSLIYKKLLRLTGENQFLVFWVQKYFSNLNIHRHIIFILRAKLRYCIAFFLRAKLRYCIAFFLMYSLK